MNRRLDPQLSMRRCAEIREWGNSKWAVAVMPLLRPRISPGRPPPTCTRSGGPPGGPRPADRQITAFNLEPPPLLSLATKISGKTSFSAGWRPIPGGRLRFCRVVFIVIILLSAAGCFRTSNPSPAAWGVLECGFWLGCRFWGAGALDEQAVYWSAALHRSSKSPANI